MVQCVLITYRQKNVKYWNQFIFIAKSKSLIINDSCVLCADGLMIEADKYYPKLLDEFKSNIMERFNIDVNFSKKEMNQDYMDTLDDNLNFKLYDEIVTTGLIANYFKIMFSNQFMVR